MSQELEIEFKNLLTEEEFNHLLIALPFPAKGNVQINYYFETPDFLLKAKQSALRIREINEQFYLTLKEPSNVGLLETHAPLTREQVNQWVQGYPTLPTNIEQQLKKMNIKPSYFVYLGKLTTTRFEFQENQLIYVLDESFYNQHHDYELELEAASYTGGVEAFEQLLQTFHIPQRKTPNKIERFYMTASEDS